jgi:hypothetical protein
VQANAAPAGSATLFVVSLPAVSSLQTKYFLQVSSAGSAY